MPAASDIPFQDLEIGRGVEDPEIIVVSWVHPRRKKRGLSEWGLHLSL